ncbi:hypothetical protein ACFXDH_43110 [Streptomyces sp. NPDC059467]|uniref:hypothetical protein n=1 Tax=Streptomyces sp. NPDC059467 TaxID=3346844 RepID=UPI0036C0205E
MSGRCRARVCWLVSPVAAVGWWLVRAFSENVQSAWRLRTRGILVTGRLESSYTYDGEGGPVERHVYAYDDVQGVTRTHTVSGDGAGRVEILCDAEHPENARIGPHTTGALAVPVLIILLIAVPVLLASLGSGAVALLALFR